MEPFENRLSGRRCKPIHSTIYSVAYCPWRGTLKTTTLLYEEFINGFFEKIRKRYKNIKPQGVEAQFVERINTMEERMTRLFEDALVDATEIHRAAEAQKTDNTIPKMQIKKDINGNIFVDVTEDILANGDKLSVVLAKIIHEKFHNLVAVNKQKIRINSDTNQEWRRSPDSQRLLRKKELEKYDNKQRAFVNADELLSSAKNWVGEKPTHKRKDNIKEFARGVVRFRTPDGKGYEADILVGTLADNSAVLRDIIYIKEIKITEEPTTASSKNSRRISATSVTSTNLSQGSQNVNTKYQLKSLTKADEEYLKAVKKGNLATAQKLVDRAAEAVMKDSKIRDENGKLAKVYHGTEAEDFYEFDKTLRGQTDSSMYGRGYYFAFDPDYSSDFGDNIREFYLDIQNPYCIDINAPARVIADFLISKGVEVDFDYSNMICHFFAKNFGSQKFTDTLADLGYDGVVVRTDEGSDFETVAFHKNQMKLADPVTYNESGDVIPLSERFDQSKRDIRYRFKKDISEDIYYPKNAREESVFRRSLANKTSHLKDGDNEAIIINTANNVYFITADGYMSGEIDLCVPIVDKNIEYIKEQVRRRVSEKDKTRLNRLLAAYRTKRGRNGRNNIVDGTRRKSKSTVGVDSKSGADSNNTADYQEGSFNDKIKLQQKSVESMTDEEVMAMELEDNSEVIGEILRSTADIELNENKLGRIVRKKLREYGISQDSIIEVESYLSALLESVKDESVKGRDFTADLTKALEKAIKATDYGIDTFADERMGIVETLKSFTERVYLNKEQLEHLKNNDISMSQLRGKLMGKLNVSKERSFDKVYETSFTEVYLTLAEKYPALFSTKDSKRSVDSSEYALELLNVLDKVYEKTPVSAEEYFGTDTHEVARRVMSELVASVIQSKYNSGENPYIAQMREKAEARAKLRSLEKYVDTFIRQIEKPTKNNSMPEYLRKPVLELLQNLDFVTGRMTLKDGDTEKTPTKHDIKWQKNMETVAKELLKYEEYFEIIDGNTTTKAGLSVDGSLITDLNDFASNCEAGKVFDMSEKDIIKLSNLLYRLRYEISQVNKTNANKFAATIDELGQKTIDELDSKECRRNSKFLRSKAADSLFFETADAATFFELFGEAGQSVYTALKDGYDKFIFNISKIMDDTAGFFSAKDVIKWSKDVRKFTLNSGETISITIPQIMNLYVLSNRKQARGHLFENKDGKGRIELTEVKHNRNKNIGAFAVNQTDIANMILTLTKEQKAVADKMQKYLSTVIAEMGNEVTMRRYLFRGFTAKNYWPIVVSSGSVKTTDATINVGGLWAVANPSFMKHTQKGAVNTLEIGDIFDVFSKHCGSMAMFNGMSEALTDAMRWYNYNNEYGSEVKRSMKEAFSPHALKWFEKFILDLNGSKGNNEGGMGAINYLVRSTKSAAIWGNFRVAMQQWTAYFRAFNELGPRYLLDPKVMKKGGVKKAKEYCAIAKWKSMGFYTTDIGRSARQLIVGDEGVFDKIRSAGFIPAGKVDEVTFGRIWNACELKVKKESKVEYDSKAFYEEVGRVMRDVVDKTQVVDSPLHRSQIRRRDAVYSKLASAFIFSAKRTGFLRIRSLASALWNI